MSVRRGMFRLWIVVSVVYALIVIGVSIAQWDVPISQKAYIFPTSPGGSYSYTDGYGLSKSHYSIDFPHRVSLYVPLGIDYEAIVKKDLPRFTKQYVFPRSGEVTAYHIDIIWIALLVLILPPLVVLGFGAAMSWALIGFRPH
jgi:hypothetical protein